MESQVPLNNFFTVARLRVILQDDIGRILLQVLGMKLTVVLHSLRIEHLETNLYKSDQLKLTNFQL